MPKDNFTYLSGYSQYPFLIPKINLRFTIRELDIEVVNEMYIERVNKGTQKIVLKGIDIKLVSIHLGNRKLKETEYKENNEDLEIVTPAEKRFKVTIVGIINPYKNTSLEGLYFSNGLIVSQCEAEGFRRITYHPDRPDILSEFTVTIQTNKNAYKTILCNGNLIEEKILTTGEKRSIWHDPFPKPSYLFALVAGNLAEVKDKYIKSNGKEISIRVHVEPKDIAYTEHAIRSLKNAMEWDKNKYGLEYDLDEYNIVSVRHFNMGAMEARYG